jgi:hypothetical protein
VSELIAPTGKIPIDCEPGQVSDGYHTFAELYEHRCLLFAALCKWLAEAFKTHKNDKGEEWAGWFIAGFNSPVGQVTYHLPEWLYDWVDAQPIERNDGYDGHTSQDVAKRLRLLIERGWL